MTMTRMTRRKTAVAASASALLVLGGGTAALASTGSAGAPAVTAAATPFCVTFGPGASATGNTVLYNWSRIACPAGTYGVNAPAGATGPAGPPGPTGPAGAAATTVGANSESFTATSTTTDTFSVKIPPGTHITGTTTAIDLTHAAAVVTVKSVDSVTGSVVLTYTGGVVVADVIQITYSYGF